MTSLAHCEMCFVDTNTKRKRKKLWKDEKKWVKYKDLIQQHLLRQMSVQEPAEWEPVSLKRFPRTPIMTDESLIERLSRGGQRGRQEQEEAKGESSPVSGRLRTAPCHLHTPQGGTETGWERQTGDWETPEARSLPELRLMDCYVKHVLPEKATHAHTHAYRQTHTHTFISRHPSADNQSISQLSGFQSCHACSSQVGQRV